MAKHVPLSFHYNPRQITGMTDKVIHVIIVACDTLSTATEVEDDEVDKLMSKGARRYVLHLIRDTTLKVPIKQAVLVEVEEFCRNSLTSLKNLEVSLLKELMVTKFHSKSKLFQLRKGPR